MGQQPPFFRLASSSVLSVNLGWKFGDIKRHV